MKKFTLTLACAIMFNVASKAAEPVLKAEPKLPASSQHLSDVKMTKKAMRGDAENCIKLKLIPLALSTVSLQYERALNEKMSAACDVNFLFYSTTTDLGSLTGGKLSYTGFGLSPEFRYYPGEEALKGFFVGPYLTYFNMGIKAEGTDASGRTGSAELTGMTAMGGGALLGWKWIIADVFAIETHVGVSYLSMTTPTTIDVKYSDGTKKTEAFPSISLTGTLPTAGVSLGYAF
ncbi:MAG: DUF3575 domain-containing protein [Bacteroidetes bacterium]|nr:DUF3575 domain-containing protein [Bacteroidota bacterium]